MGPDVLSRYNRGKADASILWSLSGDVVNGFHWLWPVTNIHLNLDAKAADGHVGGIRDGNMLVL